MAINKEKKGEVVKTLKKAIEGAKSIVFVNFHGLTVANVSALRRKLRAEKVGYTVAKKTLLKRALDEAKLAGELPALDGEIALAYGLPAQAGEDLLAPAREVWNFQREHKEQLSIVGGVFDGKYMDKTSMLGIATIPPRETLIAQFVNLINSPIARFAIVVNQIAAKKGEGAAAPAPAAEAPATS